MPELYQEGDYSSEFDHEKAVVRKVSTGKVVKSFKGESAWMRAQILVGDLALQDSHLRDRDILQSQIRGGPGS